jgi:hypothetical protein
MTDRDRFRDLDEREARTTVADLIDASLRKIVTAVIVAGAIVGVAIWSRPSPPHYQVAVGDGKIVRINTQSGTVIACQGETCAIVLEHGQDLADHLPPPPAPPVPAPALPAPAAAPAATPAH